MPDEKAAGHQTAARLTMMGDKEKFKQ